MNQNISKRLISLDIFRGLTIASMIIVNNLGSGQEAHLPHEAWHVVQQKQGRVKPTLQMKGAAINDDGALEREADDPRTPGARRVNSWTVAGSKWSQGRLSSSDHRFPCRSS